MDLLSLILSQLLSSDDDESSEGGASARSGGDAQRLNEHLRRWRRSLFGPTFSAEERLRLYPGLPEAFEEAVQRAGGDRRKVWCLPALGFDSRIETRPALMAGGTYAPAFLVREPDDLGWPYLPGTHLVGARLLFAHSLAGKPEDWAPLLEAVKEEDESLAVVATHVERDLLALFAINAARRVLNLCVLHPGELASSLDEAAQTLTVSEKHPPILSAGVAPEKSLRKWLPRVNVLARRDASILELVEDEDAADRDAAKLPMTETVWICVGGEDRHDQQNRLLAVADAISQQPDA